jgi:hypothetical protein
MESKAPMTEKRIAKIMAAYEEPADFIRWVISIAGYFTDPFFGPRYDEASADELLDSLVSLWEGGKGWMVPPDDEGDENEK